MEYYTTSGKKITMRRIENIEPPQLDRGWVVHACLAFVDDEPAGYLKISYIPKENFERVYPDVLHFLANLRGWCGLRTALKTKDIDATLHALDRHYQYPITDGQDFEWKLSKISELTKNLTREHKKDLDGFKEFHMDKPLVDFIRVYDSREMYAYDVHGESKERPNRIDFQRQGIGLALYQDAASWMAEKGLCLYASTCQQPCATAAWLKMDELGLTHEFVSKSKIKSYNKTRKYLDFRGVSPTFEL